MGDRRFNITPLSCLAGQILIWVGFHDFEKPLFREVTLHPESVLEVARKSSSDKAYPKLLRLLWLTLVNLAKEETEKNSEKMVAEIFEHF